MSFIWTILSAIGAFLATNIDEIFVLMLFFSMVDKNLKVKHIVMGQYLGFGLLVVVSLLGAFGLTLIPEKWVGLLGLIPIYLGIKLFVKGEDEDEDSVMDKFRSGRFNAMYLNVAFITFANDGDNIGIYVPFFSTLEVEQLVITIITFFILVAVWCYLGYKLARFKYVAETLEKYGRWIVPLVFIGLGIYIMIENRTFSTLYSMLFK